MAVITSTNADSQQLESIDHENNNNNNNNNINKKKRILQIQEQYEKNNHVIIESATSIINNETTILKKIQENAFLLEERFNLHDQAWITNEIAGMIYRDLKLRGLSERKCSYVFDALSCFGDKYIKHKEHSSIPDLQSAGNNTHNKQMEQLYKHNATDITYHLKCIDEKLTPDFLQRGHSQDLTMSLLELGAQKEKLLEQFKIPIVDISQKDSDRAFGGDHKDEFEDKIPYPPTIPAKSILSKALKHLSDVIAKQSERVEREGLVNPKNGKQLVPDNVMLLMADAVEFECFKREPTLDRKWRRSWYQWLDICEYAMTWFKHSSSTKHKEMDIDGFYRELTPEAVGAKIGESLSFAKKLYKLQPYQFLFDTLWWKYVRIPRGAKHSNDLSEKLSEKSIK